MTENILSQVHALRDAHQNGVLITLPSGLQARVRPVNATTFIRSGRIPDHLTTVVEKMLSGAPTVTPGNLTMQEILDQAQVMDAFAATCLVSPQIVDDYFYDRAGSPPADAITADMLAESDKIFLLSFMGQPASALEPFRPQPSQPVDGVVGVPFDAADAERTPEYPPVGVGDDGDAGRMDGNSI